MTSPDQSQTAHLHLAPGSDVAMARDFSLKDLPASFYEDPYPTYRALQTTDPVHRMPDGSLFLTRYDDLETIYKDTTTFSSDKKIEFAPKYGEGSLLFQHHTTSLVFNDPPLHTRVRRLIAGALNPRAISELEPSLVALVDRLIDAIEARGKADLIEDFAAAIPVEVIGNLLAIPHEDRGPLRGWSLAILGALEPFLSNEVQSRGERAVSEFLDYLRQLVTERRKRPGDPNHDVLTRLIKGEAASGERLSEIELLHNCIFILNAGHETTTSLIGNGLELLLRFPEQRQQLIDDPATIRRRSRKFCVSKALTNSATDGSSLTQRLVMSPFRRERLLHYASVRPIGTRRNLTNLRRSTSAARRTGILLSRRERMPVLGSIWHALRVVSPSDGFWRDFRISSPTAPPIAHAASDFEALRLSPYRSHRFSRPYPFRKHPCPSTKPPRQRSSKPSLRNGCRTSISRLRASTLSTLLCECVSRTNFAGIMAWSAGRP